MAALSSSSLIRHNHDSMRYTIPRVSMDSLGRNTEECECEMQLGRTFRDIRTGQREASEE